MDPGIENLKSTTFFGRRLTRRQIADVQETVALFPALSRNELAKTICEHLNWTTPKGDYRVSACLRMLESLEECGILSLPAKRNTASGPRRAIEHTERSDPGPQITCGLADLEPLSLHLATETGEVAEWNELVDRHHWLGCPRPFGSHLRWFVLDREGRRLGCLLFEAAARTLPARDAWLGWSAAERDRRLHLAVSNSRFLIFPWSGSTISPPGPLRWRCAGLRGRGSNATAAGRCSARRSWTRHATTVQATGPPTGRRSA